MNSTPITRSPLRMGASIVVPSVSPVSSADTSSAPRAMTRCTSAFAALGCGEAGISTRWPSTVVMVSSETTSSCSAEYKSSAKSSQ